MAAASIRAVMLDYGGVLAPHLGWAFGQPPNNGTLIGSCPAVTYPKIA
jgi:hypothetical protein